MSDSSPPDDAGRAPVPPGWRLRPAPDLGVFNGGRTLVGGFPLRVLTLSPRGADLTTAWLAGQPVGEATAERELARRLLDAGLADPDPPLGARSTAEVTVVVPVYADADRLANALAPIARDATVIVVDDGSPSPIGAAIAAVAHRRDARYVRLPEKRGASAARNAGLRLARTPLVGFLDADCLPPPGFPGRLVDHLADPTVALVAPRIVSNARGDGPIAAYERRRSALDMGPRPSPIRPYGPVWYVPSAAMVARRDALEAGFDEDLSLGEDVDLVWRLHDAGWRLRYDPRMTVAHEARDSTGGLVPPPGGLQRVGGAAAPPPSRAGSSGISDPARGAGVGRRAGRLTGAVARPRRRPRPSASPATTRTGARVRRAGGPGERGDDRP